MKRLTFVCLAVLAVAGSAAPLAMAHASLVSARPLPGAVLREPPRRIDLYFDDVVKPLVGEVIRNRDGAVISTGYRLADSSHVVIDVRSRLDKGAYTVRWEVISDDGHRISSVYAYGIGVGTPPPVASLAPPPSGPSPLDIVLRALLYAGLLASFGTLAFADLVWLPVLNRLDLSGTDVGPVRAKGLRLIFWFAAAGCYVACSAATLELVRIPNVVTRFGRMTTALVIASAATTAVALIASAAARRSSRRWLLVTATSSAGLAVLTPSLGGHALDRSQPTTLSVAFDVGHIAAAGVWLGGLIALAVIVPAAARLLDPFSRHLLLAATARRFSGVAFGAVLVLVLSGAVRAYFELASPEQLLSTQYGRLLTVKVALFIVLLGIGWLNRTSLVPRLAAGIDKGLGREFSKLRRSMFTELLLLTAAVAAVALLVQDRPGVG
jgi:copper transport protein